MKILNETHWPTRQLRSFVTRAARIEEIPAAKLKRMRIEFGYTRPGEFRKPGNRGYSSGWAVYNGHTMRIRLGKEEVDRVDLAHCLVHEFAHIRGLHHGRMNGLPLYDRVGNWRELHAWGELLPLDLPQPAPAKPKPGIRERNAQRAVKALERAKTKLRELEAATRRTLKLITKHEQKVRYYQRVMAPACKPATLDVKDVVIDEQGD